MDELRPLGIDQIKDHLLNGGDPAAALHACDELLESDRLDPLAWDLRATVHLDLHQPTLAILDLREAARRGGPDPRFVDRLIQVLVEEGHYEEAVTAAAEARDLAAGYSALDYGVRFRLYSAFALAKLDRLPAALNALGDCSARGGVCLGGRAWDHEAISQLLRQATPALQENEE